MAKLFSVASWNVEHFKGDASRVSRVVDFLDAQSPDVFGLYEVEGKEIFSTIVQKMPGYTFQITEGLRTQEILVGVKKGMTAFLTQRTEFMSGTTHMRPGLLATITVGDASFALMFLHLASNPSPRGMGLRDDMLEHAMDFRKVLDKAAGGAGQSRYIFLGDLNTMGMEYPFGHNIDITTELAKWDKYAKKASVNMRRLAKTHANSWSNGSGASNPDAPLDHVFASTNLNFKAFANQAQVDVRGWVDQVTAAAKDKWIKDYSDHSLLYFEVHA